jgi:hypothetical protein
MELLEEGVGLKGGDSASAGYRMNTSILRQLLIQSVSFLCREKMLIWSGDKIPGFADGICFSDMADALSC